MKVFKITDMKHFMNRLLLSDMFDHFLLMEASISSKTAFLIDGRINRSFFSEDELIENGLSALTYAPFSLLRGNCYDCIKGKKAPSGFRFIFLLSPDNLAKTLARADSSFSPEDLTGVFLNLKYQDNVLTCTTGISYKTFSTDRSFEAYWDSLVPKFLSAHEISYEELS